MSPTLFTNVSPKKKKEIEENLNYCLGPGMN